MEVETETAARRFANAAELLLCWGDQLLNLKLLHDLCLVSRRFNALFSPSLYRWITIHHREGEAVQIQGLPMSGHLNNVSRLSVRRLNAEDDNGYDSDKDYEEAWENEKEFQNIMTKVVSRIPNLIMFEWLGLPLAGAIVQELQRSCSRLKSIRIDYPTSRESMQLVGGGGPLEAFRRLLGDVRLATNEQDRREMFKKPNIGLFRDLESLTLDNLCGNLHTDLSDWRSQIVQVLANSPRLEVLHLSLSMQCVERHNADQQHSLEFMSFMDLIGDGYAQAGGKPLALTSLGYGRFIHPWTLASLRKLADLAFLEELHIDTLDWISSWYFGPWRVSSTDETDTCTCGNEVFGAFGRLNCPNLRRFTTRQLGKDVGKHLFQTGAQRHSHRLAISDMANVTLNACNLTHRHPDHGGIVLHPRMLDLALCRKALDPDGLAKLTTTKVLDWLIATCADVVEGLIVHPQEKDPGRWHELCRDDDYLPDLGAIVKSLARLPKLRQLMVPIHGLPKLGRAFPTHDKSEGWKPFQMKLSDGLAERVAMRVALAVPSLRYVNVYSRYWRVWRGRRSAAVHGDADGDVAVSLEELDVRECEGVELFKGTLERKASVHWIGYPGTPTYHVEKPSGTAATRPLLPLP